MQLMIYVGGTMVLLVFGVMLTARGPFVTMKTGGGQWVLAAVRRRGAVWPCCCRRRSASTAWTPAAGQAASRRVGRTQPDAVGSSAWGCWASASTGSTSRTASSRAACPATCWPFEIISVHLLVVLVGAAYLARANAGRIDRNREPRSPNRPIVR